MVGLAHHDIGCRLDARSTGGKQELAIRGAVFLGEFVGNRHHRVEGFGLVILEVGNDRHQRAVVVEQLWRIDRGLLRAVVQHVLVALDVVEFGIALERSRSDLAHRIDQR
ncbi:hypothetical protein D3C85_1118570 [compost metagenome]